MAEHEPRNLEMGIVVSDLEGMTRFYENGLGCQRIADVQVGVGLLRRFRLGGGQVKFLHPDHPPHASNPEGGARAGVSGLRWYSITIDGKIDDVVARCLAAGGAVVTAPQQVPDGPSYVMLEDPEGNWLEILDGDIPPAQ